MSESVQGSFVIGYVCLAPLASFLHFLGIIILAKVKSELPNQKIILVNLALSELMFCLSKAIFNFLDLGDMVREWDGPTRLILQFCFLTISRMANRLMMLYLIADRFIAILLHMKYKIFFPKQRVIKITTLLWLISILHTTVFGILTFSKNYLSSKVAWNIFIYTGLALDGLILASAISTCTYFYEKVLTVAKSHRFQMAKQGQQVLELHALNTNKLRATTRSASKTCHRKFPLPFLLVITYILFNISAVIIYQVRSINGRSESHDKILDKVASVLLLVGFNNDATLYIFMQKQNRQFLKKLMPFCLQRLTANSNRHNDK